MITTFSGEFLVHPIPFEMSMDLCSHRCVYCFASVKRKINKFELKVFINQMQALQKGKKGWLYEKLREGYPVCLSNNTDPFADNNALYTESVLEYFKMLGVRVFFQTKGGKRALELISRYGIRSVVYVTITTPNDDISRRIEPNAPVSSERIELIKQLRALGHEVIVGINPLVEQWCSNEQAAQLIERLHEIGVYGVVIAPLHIGRTQKKIMCLRDFAGFDLRKDLSPFGINKGGYGNAAEVQLSSECKTIGMPIIQPSRVFDICKEVYNGKVLPTIWDFLNEVKDLSLFTKDEFERWFIERVAPFNDGNIKGIWDRYIILKDMGYYTKNARRPSTPEKYVDSLFSKDCKGNLFHICPPLVEIEGGYKFRKIIGVNNKKEV